MDPITIFVSEFSIMPYMAGFTLAIAAVLVGIIVGVDRFSNRRRLEGSLFLVLGLIVAGAIGTISYTTLVEHTKAHEIAQIDSIDNQLSQELGLPIHIFGENIIGFVRTPSSFGEGPGAQLRISYKLDGETYWRAIDVRSTDAKDGRYGFEVLQIGEPMLIEDFIDQMEVPLTPEGLIPAEPAEKDADR